MGKKVLGWLIAFQVSLKLKPAERTKFFRQLYGYRDRSQYGKYEYERNGLLRKIPHVPLIRAAIIVSDKNKRKVLAFLRRKVGVKIRRVILNKEDRKRLFLGREKKG